MKSGLFQATYPTKSYRPKLLENVKKTDRQTGIKIYNIQHTTLNKYLPNMKYMLDKLIVMNVYTAVKCNLCF